MYRGIPRNSDLFLTSLMNKAPHDRRVVANLNVRTCSPNADPSYSLGPDKDRKPIKDTDINRLGQMVDMAYREMDDLERQRSEDQGYPLA